MKEITRHEEELRVEKEPVVAGAVEAQKRTDVDHVTEVVPRDVEDADIERVAPKEGDSGEIETLPDGSVSIPLFEEQLVVTKQLVVRERVIVRKRTVTKEHRIDAELRRERIEIESMGDVELEDDVPVDTRSDDSTRETG